MLFTFGMSDKLPVPSAENGPIAPASATSLQTAEFFTLIADSANASIDRFLSGSTRVSGRPAEKGEQLIHRQGLAPTHVRRRHRIENHMLQQNLLLNKSEHARDTGEHFLEACDFPFPLSRSRGVLLKLRATMAWIGWIEGQRSPSPIGTARVLGQIRFLG